MAGDPKSEVWLTFALTKADVANALTLCYSLKRVLTFRKIGVILSNKLSTPLKMSLHQSFDYLFYLEEGRNTVELKEADFVKLFPLTLKAVEMCVFLPPNMLAVNNSDRIFDECRNLRFSGYLLPEGVGLDMFVMRPSWNVFENLTKGLLETGGMDMEKYIRKWTKANNQTCQPLSDKYNHLLSVHGFPQPGEQTEVLLVNTRDIRLDMNTEELGMFTKVILKEWKLIYQESVQPLLEKTEQGLLPMPDDSAGLLGYNKEPIAIVGMSCRYPGANSLQEFWHLLLNKKDGTGTPPDCRWLSELTPFYQNDYRKTNAGFLQTPVEEFDAKFFGISPSEMVYLDPQHRLLMQLVWEALEDAAVDPKSLSGTNSSVFLGTWTNDYKDILTLSGDDHYFRKYMGNSIGAAAARVSHFLEITGPSIATESGCSASMVAVHLACRNLQMRETNFALACGVNLLLRPFAKETMPLVLSENGLCKTFDAKADGFARAEGCGVLALKRLSDAVRDGDRIWALVRGSGLSQEGLSKSMGTPTVHSESLAMELALRDAQVEPEQVSYVEAHGTGTPVGDPMEVASIAKAYHSKLRKEPLLIGSVKTNVGHTESCSGITGIMKVVLAMQYEIIPPHRNFEELNPAIDLDALPAKIPLEPVPWPKQVGIPRLAGVSSFGITGTDAHAILEESPEISSSRFFFRNSKFKRPLHIMKISAKTKEALSLLIEKHRVHFCDNATEQEMKDLSYTANTGRSDFDYRAVILASSKDEALQCIEKKKFLHGERESEKVGKICFLFTGQGSQYPGMAKQLYQTSPVFRMHFEYCETILKNEYGLDITKVLWSESESKEVSRTIYSQTSIFCVEYALLKLWESWGVKADYVIGHSLGEFAAAVCAGILTVEDAIKLVAERSRLIDQLPQGKMLVIKAKQINVDSIMNKFAGTDKSKALDYAAINSSEQTVVAGDSDLVLEFSETCKQGGLKCVVLEGTHAFHSKHMDPMLDDYRKVAQSVNKLEDNGCKYISGVKGKLIDGDEVNAEYWIEHTRERVLFMDASKIAVDLGCKTFIEIGPKPILSALTMMNNDTEMMCLPSLKRNENEWETLLNTLGKLYVNGYDINWKGLDAFYERKKVSLPHYPFIGKKFWPNVESSMSTKIHPLLGTVIPNALTTKLFKCDFNLNKLEYVKDHLIGDKCIFPGAGYLEMVLAAGHASLQGTTDSLPPPTFSMKVENLIIGAPLQLQDSKLSQIQTTVELNNSTENQEFNVRIYRKSESNKWLSHATASFSPLPTVQEKRVSIDINMFRETLAKTPDENYATRFYDAVATAGVKFGPIFRSLETVWNDKDTKKLVFEVKFPPTQEDGKGYITHPVVLDAMIQSIWMLREGNSLKKKLFVPIKIGKFIWLSATDSSELFIQAFNSSSVDEGTAVLLDGHGNVLAIMSSVEFIHTTVKAIEAVLEQQTSRMPDMWEEVWKKELGPLELAVDLEKARGKFYTDEFVQQIENTYNHSPPHMAETFKLLEELAYLYILESIYNSGWKPELDQVFEEDSLFLQLKIQQDFRKYFKFMLNVLKNEGILQNVDYGNTWKVVGIPPSLEQVETTLASKLFTSDLVERFNSTLLLSKFGQNLTEIMKGEQSALSILFPGQNKGYPSVTDFYYDYGKVFQQKQSSITVCRERVSHIRNQMKGEPFTIRILEVGAGTGTYTSDFLYCLEEEGIQFEYTFTDISPAFFSAAEKKFEKYGKRMKFRKFNLEEDPIDQGFIPEYFDFVYIAEVIHATRDIKESLRNVWMLMKPFAKLNMLEGIGVHRFLTFLFGSLEGFWRFQDFDLRPNHCTLSTEAWNKVLSTSGFEVDGIFPILNNHHAHICATKVIEGLPMISPHLKSLKVFLVFNDSNSPISNFLIKKISETTTRQVIEVTSGDSYENNGETFIVRKLEEDDYIKMLNAIENLGLILERILYCWALDKRLVSQDEILQPYFYLSKAIIASESKNCPRLIALTNGGVALPDTNGSIHFHTSTLLGFTKSLKNENVELDWRFLDLTADYQDDKTRMQEVFYEIWRWEKDADTMVTYRDNSRYFPKLQPLKPSHITNKLLSLPKGANRFQLILPETKLISDLQFGLLDTPHDLLDDEVEVQIKAYALNFKDIFCIIKAIEQFKNLNRLGFDIAGVVKRVGKNVKKWKVGDRVNSCNLQNIALPSHLVFTDDQLMRIPDDMSFCEASTIPVVYSTSIVGLLEVAKITKKDVVLIHTAAGGVGLSAIEVCKHVGCTIIATAGSKRKHNYLKELGIRHVFNSRNTEYANQILKVTNGRGVDVVLNSLTSEGFKEATLKSCTMGARFVEMSKLNVWTTQDVKEMRPDVKYTIIEINKTKQEWLMQKSAISELQKKNVVKPIPYVRFDALDIRDALLYLQKAKHIGKVVCVMPELRNEGGDVKVFTPLFNERSTYLITGGMGGIGFAVCQWMVENGAKHVILAGRSLPSPAIQLEINEINSRGACIVPVQLDVGNFEQCKDLIEIQIPKTNLPPLKGVIHSAGTLADGLVINQDWKKLSSTFNAKIDGTLNLHKLTKSMNLEYFVLFSSMSAIVGPPGQCNHSAANAFKDAFAHYRSSIGLPATAINWGPWSEVGAATEVEVPGVKAISNLQGLAALEFALKTHRTQTAVFGVSSFVLFRRMWPHHSFRKYLDEKLWNKTGPTLVNSGIEEAPVFWEEFDATSNKAEVMKTHVRNTFRNILKLDQNDVFADDVDIKVLGMDSLMFIEIKNRLQTLFGDRLSITASSIRDSKTVELLSTTLVGLIEGKFSVENRKPTFEEMKALIREDSQLPEHIQAQSQKVGSVNEIKNVFLTGCTGTFGPYVLMNLTNLPQISQVICLMRHSKREAGEERLHKVLSKLELLSKVDMGKVRCVSGNVAEPNLGMKPSDWEELSRSVDAIFHCAASVQHVEYYRNTESKSDMRAVNIGGTKNVLEFACKNRLKHVYHASSLLAVATLDENGRVSEKWPEVGDFDEGTMFGYPVTKFVGDVLMKQAVERGIPCKVFRLPLMAGESRIGRCSIENNHFLLRYIFIMKTGIMSSAPFVVPTLPVDICADVSLQIFFNDDAGPDVYNITPGFPDTDQKFVEVAKEFGYNVDLVEFSEFAKRVMGSGEEASALEAFKEFYNDEDESLKATARSPVFGGGNEESEDELRNKWWSEKVAKLVPNFFENQKQSIDYIRQDLLFCKSQGWFKRFGL